MKNSIMILCVCLPLIAWTQADSEILLFDVKVEKGKMVVSNPMNISNHIGYDNQPSFHPSKPLVYYASFNEEGRSDIKVYNYQLKTTTSLTQTPEREYSPTCTPDGKYISCIIQRDNDAQDLGKYPVNGGEAITLISNLIVGYHSWIDQNNLIVFVLGDPVTLRWVDLATGKDQILAENIGRSLHKIPKTKAMSFVHKKSENEWIINSLDIASKKISPLIAALAGREDMAWTQGGDIVMSDGTKLFICNPSKKENWEEVELRSGTMKVEGITRLALSQNGKKLAMVVSE